MKSESIVIWLKKFFNDHGYDAAVSIEPYIHHGEYTRRLSIVSLDSERMASSLMPNNVRKRTIEVYAVNLLYLIAEDTTNGSGDWAIRT